VKKILEFFFYEKWRGVFLTLYINIEKKNYVFLYK